MCAIEVAPTLTTERLTLRPVRIADAPAIGRYASDYDVAKMTSRIPHPFGVADAERFVASIGLGVTPDEAAFAIRHDGALIGVLGFHRSHDLDWPEVGYWLGKPWWGKGFATEALNTALVWARDGWGRKAVRAGHFADNPASAAVLVKAGFLYTGQTVKARSVARQEEVDMRMMIRLA